jgi:hypothetical protein
VIEPMGWHKTTIGLLEKEGNSRIFTKYANNK